MSETLIWWVMVQVVGLATLPLCLTLFRRLPDRGYALSKPFALLMTGYVFWILVIIGLPNTTVSIAWVLVLLALGSAYLFWRRREELLAFVREHWWLIAATEVLFFLAFITAAYLRSFVGAIEHTEQPMDFMFLNALTRADGYPPEDPWMSGENVPYYYFGYLLVSVMTRLSDLATSVGYNLGLAMIVALAVTAVFGLVYDLTAPREERAREAGPRVETSDSVSRPLWRPMAFGLAAGLLLSVMGNLEGLLEWLAAHGIGSDGFWGWVGIENLPASYESTRWYPAGTADQVNWFWFRAPRVLEVKEGLFGIHEFPFFSFMLGDLHPHVMSIPFVLLAVGAALALLRSDEPLDLVFWLERPFRLVAIGLIVGGLAFLNTWDMPTMAVVVVLAALLRNRLLAGRWSWGLALDTLGFTVPLLLVAFLAYTPFFFGGFDSQASGFTADAFEGTRLFHAMLVWGPFAGLVLPYAIWRLSRHKQRIALRHALWALAPAAIIVGVWLIWDVLAFVGGWLPGGFQLNDAEHSLGTRIGDRGWNWITVLLLGGSLGLLVLALVREVDAARGDEEERLSHIFALALSAVAALLILGAEFFFIQDFFNSRMNTIFKLYYQAWLLLSVAGGFVMYELAGALRKPRTTGRRIEGLHPLLGDWSFGELLVAAATVAGGITGAVLKKDTVFGLRVLGAVIGAGLLFAAGAAAVLAWRGIERRDGALSWHAPWASAAAVLLLAGFVYPLIVTYSRTNSFDLPRTLDGLAYLRASSPAEYEAVKWLSERDGQPVIAEAVGKGYQVQTSSASGATGLPTVLGWQGHEEQWRGGNEKTIPRAEDLATLYASADPDQVKSIIQKYGITYVFLGNVERQAYPDLTVAQMNEILEPAFEQGDVTVYRVRPGILSEATLE